MTNKKEYMRAYGLARKLRQKIEEPWYVSYKCAKARCNNPNMPNYHRYGGRGIQFLLTMNDIILLWIRDCADLLEHPTLDRVDNNGNYEIDNCRFIELSENSRIANEKPVRQYSKDGEYLTTYESIVKASKSTGIKERNIGECTSGRSNTAGGFIWSNNVV